jgi:hypothetical protein
MHTGDHISFGSLSGSGINVGSGSNTYSVGHAQAHQDEATSAAHRAPEQGLYAFADVVGYSNLTARLQKISQDDLARLLDASLAEAGIRPDLVTPQDQGDARLLTFPAGTDAGKVLATMPRYLNDELHVRNEDMAAHAQMRVRLSFTMGVAVPGGTGLAGGAPIAAVRLANSAVFRHVMNSAPQAHCGVIIDDYLHGEYVRLRFRPDIDPGDYISVHVSYPDKGFDAAAWLMLFGYVGHQVAALLK